MKKITSTFTLLFDVENFERKKKSIIRAKIKENMVKDNTIRTYQIKIRLFEILKFKINICLVKFLERLIQNIRKIIL